MLIQCIYVLVNYQEAITGTSCWTGRVGEREEEEDWYIVILILHYDCVSNSTCIYRLDGMMMGLQDIHWTERTVTQCMF